jgi:hypothetical protein
MAMGVFRTAVTDARSRSRLGPGARTGGSSIGRSKAAPEADRSDMPLNPAGAGCAVPSDEHRAGATCVQKRSVSNKRRGVESAVFTGSPHGMPTTEAAAISADLLALFGS